MDRGSDNEHDKDAFLDDNKEIWDERRGNFGSSWQSYLIGLGPVTNTEGLTLFSG